MGYQVSPRGPVEKRFWGKVYKTQNCWFWIGNITGGGYGHFSINGRHRPAQVVAWELFHGRPFPDAKWGLHTCDIKQCVRPDHIFPGTRSDNMVDAVRKGMGHQNRIVEKCKHGHPFDEENTYVVHWRGQIKRQCRKCSLNRWHKKMDLARRSDTSQKRGAEITMEQ
jgi:hypothetical protein